MVPGSVSNHLLKHVYSDSDSDMYQNNKNSKSLCHELNFRILCSHNFIFRGVACRLMCPMSACLSVHIFVSGL